MRPQRTISTSTEVTGRGLFTGEEVTVRFRPAPPDAGAVFIRAGSPSPSCIRAHVSNVTKRARRTSLRNGTLSIETVEHCLAALNGLGIDNVEIEVSGGELPGGDGSARLFADALQRAGIQDQQAARKPLIIQETVRVVDGDAELIAVPSAAEGLDILYDLDYGPDGLVPRQVYAVRITEDTFRQELAAARTFLFEEEARQFQAAGLGTHLTCADIVVIGPQGVIENEFRYPDECVRHKVLDLIGDLYLAGRPIYGKIIARKTGHTQNHELVRRLVQSCEEQECRAYVRRPAAINASQLHHILPHRFPFLLVDRVVEIDGDRRAVGLKNVSINEPYFQGHFPSQPIMPGVLIIESMAQLAGILLSQKLEHAGKVAVLLSMDHVKFRRPVIPGDQLVLEAETLKIKSRTGHVRCRATVNDELVSQAEIKFMMVDAEPG